MTLLAVPNLSEGRDERAIAELERAVAEAGARVLDRHSDTVHNRTVLTASAPDDVLVDAMVELAGAARDLIDLTRHEGVHPRVGALDVCPFVPFRQPIDAAVHAARSAGERIGELGIPVFLYGEGAGPSLPELRRGALEGLTERVSRGAVPDFGPPVIDPRTGVVLVGARGPLIAFNVNLDADPTQAREIAARVRESGGGLSGVRALGLRMPTGSQVSMNITQPERIGIDDAFAAVDREATSLGVGIVSTESVGLIEQRFLPDPNAKAARLLVEPGRSVESQLTR